MWYNWAETAHSKVTKGDHVSQRLLDKIRDAILRGDYDLTRHAVEKMAEDDLIIYDVEGAILDGAIVHSGGALYRNGHLSCHYRV